jgi:hypothetical protein
MRFRKVLFPIVTFALLLVLAFIGYVFFAPIPFVPAA